MGVTMREHWPSMFQQGGVCGGLLSGLLHPDTGPLDLLGASSGTHLFLSSDARLSLAGLAESHLSKSPQPILP